jgi:hypothetical protein
MRSLITSACLLGAGLIVGSPTLVQAQEKPFCLENPSGSRSCNYDTLDQCQQVLRADATGGGCVANPASGTSGQGGTSQDPNPNNEPSKRDDRRLSPSR